MLLKCPFQSEGGFVNATRPYAQPQVGEVQYVSQGIFKACQDFLFQGVVFFMEIRRTVLENIDDKRHFNPVFMCYSLTCSRLILSSSAT